MYLEIWAFIFMNLNYSNNIRINNCTQLKLGKIFDLSAVFHLILIYSIYIIFLKRCALNYPDFIEAQWSNLDHYDNQYS